MSTTEQMKIQNLCPCCGEHAMTIWQKIMLTRFSTHPCQHCGALLGAEETASTYFILGWVPISLSGLFPTSIEIALVCIGVGIMLFPHFYLTPLIEKPGGIREKPPTWQLSWLAIVLAGALASSWVNLLPSSGTKIIAFAISLVFSALLAYDIWRLIPNAEEKGLLFGGGAVVAAALHYLALSCLPPALLAFVAGEHAVIDAKIVRKEHTSKTLRCSNKVDIAIGEEKNTHRICLTDASAANVKIGDTVAVISLNTDYGRLITAIEPKQKTRSM